MFCSCAAQTAGGSSQAQSTQPLADDPRNAVYEIDGETLPLRNGMLERPIVEGSAAKDRTHVLGPPVFGDLDGDGENDAVAWLVRQTGGSGSFYYLAGAYGEGEGYRGTTALLVGDRIVPRDIVIEHRVVSARFLDRSPEESMAVPPTVAQVRYFTAASEGLRPVDNSSDRAVLHHGWLTIGHEVRSFQPCGAAEPLWLMPRGVAGRAALHDLTATLTEGPPVSLHFVSLLGQKAQAPDSGFGADYAGGFALQALVQVWPGGNCISDRIVVERPLPGSALDAALDVRGRARGAWFFEGELGLELIDSDRKVLVRSFATAEGDWMTDGFVPFAGKLTLDREAQAAAAILVVRKNNPSADRALDERLEVPLRSFRAVP